MRANFQERDRDSRGAGVGGIGRVGLVLASFSRDAGRIFIGCEIGG